MFKQLHYLLALCIQLSSTHTILKYNCSLLYLKNHEKTQKSSSHCLWYNILRPSWVWHMWYSNPLWKPAKQATISPAIIVKRVGHDMIFVNVHFSCKKHAESLWTKEYFLDFGQVVLRHIEIQSLHPGRISCEWQNKYYVKKDEKGVLLCA